MNPMGTAVYFRRLVKIEQRQETRRVDIATGRCAGPPLPRRLLKRPQRDQPLRWGRFFEPDRIARVIVARGTRLHVFKN